MKALTLHRPWPFIILHWGEGAKRVENRPWKPWASVIGRRIAIHAGKAMDDAALFKHGLGALRLTDERVAHEGIVGTARVKGWVHVNRELLLPAGEDVTHSQTLTSAEARAAIGSVWFFGPYGWVLDDVRALETPIPCSGAQGLWDIPANIMKSLELLGETE